MPRTIMLKAPTHLDKERNGEDKPNQNKGISVRMSFNLFKTTQWVSSAMQTNMSDELRGHIYDLIDDSIGEEGKHLSLWNKHSKCTICKNPRSFDTPWDREEHQQKQHGTIVPMSF